MQLQRTLSLVTLLVVFFSFSSLRSQNHQRPSFGESHQDIVNYFLPIYESKVHSQKYTRSIFKLYIEQSGKVRRAEAVNHPFDTVTETKILDKIYQMIWNPLSTGTGAYLIIVEKADGQININIR